MNPDLNSRNGHTIRSTFCNAGRGSTNRKRKTLGTVWLRKGLLALNIPRGCILRRSAPLRGHLPLGGSLQARRSKCLRNVSSQQLSTGARAHHTVDLVVFPLWGLKKLLITREAPRHAHDDQTTQDKHS